MIIEISIIVVGLLGLLLGRLALKGYYLAIEDLKVRAKHGSTELEELIRKKDELFSILFSYYLCGFLLYFGYIMTIIYDWVAPKL